MADLPIEGSTSRSTDLVAANWRFRPTPDYGSRYYPDLADSAL